MLILMLLVAFAIFGMLTFTFIVLRSVFSIVGILIIGSLLMIPFIWLIHPWFELVIIVLLVVMIVQKQSREV